MSRRWFWKRYSYNVKITKKSVEEILTYGGLHTTEEILDKLYKNQGIPDEYRNYPRDTSKLVKILTGDKNFGVAMGVYYYLKDKGTKRRYEEKAIGDYT